MKQLVYSNFYQIPKGHRDGKLIDACLVLEGGALRGLYTAGVLDALLLNDIHFKYVVGTSAGALTGANYVSGDVGRSARMNLAFRFDKRYVGIKAAVENKGVFGFNFLLEDYNLIDPMSFDSLNNPNRHLIACASCLETGQTEFFENLKCSDFFKALRASASMPYLSAPIEIDGFHYLDGGCSCKVPYIWPLNNNIEKIVVLRTRDLNYRKKNININKENKMIFHNYPNFIPVIDDMNLNYNKQCDEMEKLSNEGRILMLTPSEPISISRIESDIEKLGQLYERGYKDGNKFVLDIKEYLAREKWLKN